MSSTTESSTETATINVESTIATEESTFQPTTFEITATTERKIVENNPFTADYSDKHNPYANTAQQHLKSW